MPLSDATKARLDELDKTILKVEDDKQKALKYDDGKPPMDLLPGAALREISRVLGFGARKYSQHNWRQGFKWSRLHAAALRHLTSYQDGERLDPESGLSHLAHAGCMLLFLLTHEVEGLGEVPPAVTVGIGDELCGEVPQVVNPDVLRFPCQLPGVAERDAADLGYHRVELHGTKE